MNNIDKNIEKLRRVIFICAFNNAVIQNRRMKTTMVMVVFSINLHKY